MPIQHSVEDFLSLHDFGNGPPLLDVRSPGEFAGGHIPGAWNVPLLSDEQRVRIGTTYARSGKEGAVRLALELVGPDLAEKLDQARRLAGTRREVLLHCWRGGMRSASLAWLLETDGFLVHLLAGGYKAYRAYVRETLARPAPVWVLGGMTGCGKTDILHEMATLGCQVIDLEGLAHHRGSAFGGIGQGEQPRNEAVENELQAQWARLDFTRPIWMEDESRRIGSVSLSEAFYTHITSGKCILVDMPLALRVRRLVRMYTQGQDDDALIQGLDCIRLRLGHATYQECVRAIQSHHYAEAVQRLLVYYDKAYAHSMCRQQRPIACRMHFPVDDPHSAARLLASLEKDAFNPSEMFGKEPF